MTTKKIWIVGLATTVMIALMLGNTERCSE
jgi:hypothetical protein